MARKSKSFFESMAFKVGMKYLYGIGAAVVIVGALFKILHLPGANLMLIIGLSTEAAIFAVSAFAPLPHEETHWEWEKVFPELKQSDDDDDDEAEEAEELVAAGGRLARGGGQAGPGLNLDTDTLNAANKALTPELFESLSTSIKGLSKGVEGLTDVTETSVATQEFGAKVKAATSKVDQLSQGYSASAEAMKQFSTSMTQVKNYQEQISTEVKTYQQTLQTMNKNMASLNNVYEIELQDAQKHLNSINKFYGSISSVMQNLLDTSKDTDNLRKEVANLASNMHSLNSIYGNMLTAMATGAAARK